MRRGARFQLDRGGAPVEGRGEMSVWHRPWVQARCRFRSRGQRLTRPPALQDYETFRIAPLMPTRTIRAPDEERWQRLGCICDRIGPWVSFQSVWKWATVLDMSINVKKSSCIRIGHRHNVTCASITTCHGQPLHWVSEFRYFGSIHCFIAVFQMFTCVC